MTDIPAFPYASLWGERVIRSVANLTRSDGVEFLKFAQGKQIDTVPLEQANTALARLRSGALQGAAVLTVN